MHADEMWMNQALLLARRGRFTTTPNPCVGCVIVNNDEKVGEGYHWRAGEPHAEIHALNMAGSRARGATAYVTLEPCCHHGLTPPCTDALVRAGITRLVTAMQDPNPQVCGRGLYQLKQAGIIVQHGLMQAEAEVLNRGFCKRMRSGFPWVQLKIAASLDGRTAMAGGESKWITSAAARADVQQLRAQCCAILSTSATVLADDPALTVRWETLDAAIKAQYPKDSLRQPVRVILDSQNRVSAKHQVIRGSGLCWLARLSTDDSHWPDNSEQLLLPEQHGHVDLVLLLMELSRRQINSVLVEAGAQLSGALLSAGLVDELILYLAPKLLGNEARALCMLPGLHSLAQAVEFTISAVCQVGPDLRLHLKPESRQ